VVTKYSKRGGFLSFVTLFKFLPILVILSCEHKKNFLQDDVIAILDKNLIHLSDIDSIHGTTLYEMRRTSLIRKLEDFQVKTEANDRKISQKNLFANITKDVVVLPHDLENFRKWNPNYTNTKKSSEISELILQLKKQDYFQKHIFNLLIKNDKIGIYLNSTYKEFIGDLKGIITGSLDAETKIVFVSDYRCPECYNKYIFLKELIQEYEDYISVEYVFYTNIDDYLAMYSYTLTDSRMLFNYLDILYSQNYNQNMVDSFKDVLTEIDLQALKGIMDHNMQILQNNEIFSVPIIIINGKILPYDQIGKKFLDEILINVLTYRKNE